MKRAILFPGMTKIQNSWVFLQKLKADLVLSSTQNETSKAYARRIQNFQTNS